MTRYEEEGQPATKCLRDVFGDADDEELMDFREYEDDDVMTSVSKRPPVMLDFAVVLDDKTKSKEVAEDRRKDIKRGPKRGKCRRVRLSRRDLLLQNMPLVPSCFFPRSKSCADLGLNAFEYRPGGKPQDDAQVRYHLVEGVKEASSGSFPLQCLHKLLPESLIPCRLGPLPRATYLVVSSASQSIAMILVSPVQSLAVPLWNCCDDAISALQREVDALVPDKEDTDHLIYLRFWKICNKISEVQKDHWISILDQASPSQPRMRRTCDVLAKAFSRAKLPVGVPADPFNLLGQRIDRHCKNDRQGTGDGDASVSSCDGPSNTCLICFDEIQGGGSQLVTCGHTTCFSCWTEYFNSRRTADVVCPAIGCQTSLDIFDSAHVLFRNDDDFQNDRQNLFFRLVDKELEEANRLNSGRYCPSPNCGRLLTRLPTRSQVPGMNMYLCSCGCNVCADCLVGESHPGMSCAAFQMFKDDIGKADAEYKNYRWQVDHSRPCPKCKFPIFKDGGCNHVSCSKCYHYFCWQCGGPGSRCLAFDCFKPSWNWKSEPEFNISSYKDLLSMTIKNQKYLQTEKRIKLLWKNLRSSRKNNDTSFNFLLLELQLQQVILWMYALLANQFFVTFEAYTQINELELMLQAINVRLTMADQMKHESPSRQIDDVFSDAMNLSKQDSKKQPPGSGKELEHADVDDVMKEFGDMITSLELKDLCVMGNKKFLHRVQLALKDWILFLAKSSNLKEPQRRRRHRPHRNRKKVMATMENENMPLNKRRVKVEPWKLGEERVKNDHTQTDKDKRSKWKGKTKAKALRILPI